MGYRYTQGGERRQLIYPDGDRLTYTRDKAGRAVSTTDWANRVMSFEYWPDGKLKLVTHVNGAKGEYFYDNARRLTSITNRDHPGEILSQHLYTLDAVGNRTRVDEVIRPIANAPGTLDTLPGARALPSQPGTPGTLPGARPLPSQAGGVATLPGTHLTGGGSNPLIAGYVAYTYDRLYRLTATSGPIEAATYTYDAVGNRTSKTPNGQSAITYTYDKADRILSAGGVAYTVDANGNLTARGTEELIYDQANRLRELRQSVRTATACARATRRPPHLSEPPRSMFVARMVSPGRRPAPP